MEEGKMEHEAIESNESNQGTKDKDEKRHITRRKIEDLMSFKRMREEHCWMDDEDFEFGEVY